MARVQFQKLYEDATWPQPYCQDGSYYKLFTRCLLRKEIRNGEKHYYLGTGIIAIQPPTHQLYIVPSHFDIVPSFKPKAPTSDFSDAFKMVDTIGVILPEDRTEIIVHIKQIRPYNGSPMLLNEGDIARLYFLPKAEKVYFPLTRRFNYCDDTGFYKNFHHYRILINGNVYNLNYLINAMSPIPGGFHPDLYQFSPPTIISIDSSRQGPPSIENPRCTTIEKRMKNLSYKWLEKVKKLNIAGLSAENVRDDESDDEEEYHSQSEIANLFQYVLENNGIEFLFKEKSVG